MVTEVVVLMSAVKFPSQESK